MKPPRWTIVSPSAYDWEREALEFVREHLPDREPWRAWSNLEFIDDDGRVNEIDLLVLTTDGLVLIEIKSRPGIIQGDAHSWTWLTDGRRFTYDNPLLLANRKAKRLKSLLARQPAFIGARAQVPWISEAIFLSTVSVAPRIDPGTARRVFLRGNPRSPADKGIVGALAGNVDLGFGRRGSIDPPLSRAVTNALQQAGIRPANRNRQIGDYVLERLLSEGEGWQDFLAKHASLGVLRRVRIYPYARAASPEERQRLGRMATREFRVLEGIEHPGILKVLDFRETELGPALIFEHDPSTERFDRFLLERLSSLTASDRLALVRQLAEALGHAHSRRLYHRALAPQNVLVRNLPGDQVRLQIMNWQVASRAESSQTAFPGTSGTQLAEENFADPAKVYVAPEALTGGETAAPADVFSLGAIAYHLFAGRPPADDPLSLATKLRETHGLRLSEAVDGVGPELEELIRASTDPIARGRIGSAGEFLEYLSFAEKELSSPDSPSNVDPSIAKPGDRLDGDLIVVRKLGSGSTANALLVRRAGEEDAEELVLKVAIDEAHGDRVRAEAEVLRRLHHQNIVRFVDALTVSGRAAILMEKAGDRTLAERLRGDETPSLDLMRRFGEDLLQALDHLEQQGVAHRDIKPHNIGIAARGSGRLHLVLFDFSLARTPPENIQAGTRPYLDPFLPLRRPQRWDLHAERFAAAMTLHELVAGTLPIWGDGSGDYLVTDDEATIAVDRFDPSLREGLTHFFSTALRRNADERFGNAEDMLRDWRRSFEPLDRHAASEDSIEVITRRLDGRSSITDVGYGVEARDVLDRMGIHTVQQLLAVDRIKFRYLRGVGDRVRKEIRERAKAIAQLRPDLRPGGLDDSRGLASIDRLADQLLPRRPAGDETSDDRLLATYLGLEGAEGASAWPTPGEVARSAEVARSVIAAAIEQARNRWHKIRDLNELRAEVAVLLQSAGGVASASEIATLLLAARGSVQDDGADRTRLSMAVLRAAVELEASVGNARFAAYADAAPILLASSAELADYARRLGAAADRLARQEPLPAPGRVEEELGLITAPAEVAFPTGRLLRLATASSGTASLSARSELYPKGMLAIRALKLSLGSLAGAPILTEAAIRERVRGRFPESEPLPARPQLDRLLAEVGAEREWREGPSEQPGYVSLSFGGPSGSTPTSLVRHATEATAPLATAEVLDARALEEKIAHAARTGSFLALTVDPRRAANAEAELLRRFGPRERISLDIVLLRAMHTEADSRKIKWPVVQKADAGPRSKDFTNLLRLARAASEHARADLMALDRPALLVNPGLFARYDLMRILSDLASASGTKGGPPGIWLLIPQSDDGMPSIDGAALPVIGSANWARLTDHWLANAHRAGARPPAAA